MNLVEACGACQRLSADYEAATMEWFRIQSQLRIAEYSHDDQAANRIMDELTDVARKRQTLRESIDRHIGQTMSCKSKHRSPGSADLSSVPGEDPGPGTGGGAVAMPG